MEGRTNNETGLFEVFYKNEWVVLTDDNWLFVKKEISLKFLITIYYESDELSKGRAFTEFKRRIKYVFDLKLLWTFSLSSDRIIGDLALNEIFDRSGKFYILSHNRNR